MKLNTLIASMIVALFGASALAQDAGGAAAAAPAAEHKTMDAKPADVHAEGKKEKKDKKGKKAKKEDKKEEAAPAK